MKLHLLENRMAKGYAAFGCMWKQGQCGKDTRYVCKVSGEEEGTEREIPLQSRITAYWPDGTVKWTAHTADAALLGEEMQVLPGTPGAFEGMRCLESQEEIRIYAGAVTITINKDGHHLFSEVEYHGKTFLQEGEAVLILEEPVMVQGNPARMEKHYRSRIEKVSVEETGKLRTILRYDGIHESASGDRKLPFLIRMEAGFQDPGLKFTHTFLYDGDESRDFLKGLGIRFRVPMKGELYNRHVKFTGDHGVFHETLVPLTAWRPRIPEALYRRQMEEEMLTLTPEEREPVDRMLRDVPIWSEYTLCQDSVNHFEIRKKLSGGELCYLDSLHGCRTAGGGAFGSEHGSIMAVIRDFWEKYPSGIQFKNLEEELAECTLWFWSPDARPMDFRHYAGRGYSQVCYEGYDYKGAAAEGIACTNECAVSFSREMIPADAVLEEYTETVNHPAVYVGSPEFYHDNRAFGYWSLPGKSTETEAWLEEQLEQAFAFYKEEIRQRNWYGMFNYGDVMHTYDALRHQWKYDMGGYAWDNTELVPTLWLWLYFLRTGREDVYRMAEKLSRHASEVDVYHMGKYKGLGSRHNVRHWGCPCKEARIAMAGHHRYLYYLTGDRRLEDIFDELKDNELSFLNKDPLGDFYDRAEMVCPSHARSGPDWSSLCSNWMTRWERTLDTRYLDKIKTGIQDIGNMPLRLVSGPDFEFDPASCHLRYIGERVFGGTHLQICMGAPQIWTELGDLLGETDGREEWKDMLADLGRIYFMTKEERQEATGGLLGKREFTYPFMAAGIGAYAAARLGDSGLARRVWKALLGALRDNCAGDGGSGGMVFRSGENEREDFCKGFRAREIPEAGNQEILREIPWLSTNFASQFCLNVIMCLEFIRSQLPADLAALRALEEKII